MRITAIIKIGTALALASLVGQAGVVAQKVFTVCPKDCNYTTIQAAIFESPEGSVIQVKAGRYPEALFIAKGVTLVGDGRDNTFVEGPVFISVDRVALSISGFTLKGHGIQITGSEDAMINLEKNRIIDSISDGISISHSKLVAVRGNEIYNNQGSGATVTLGSTAIFIANTIRSNNGDGVSAGGESPDFREALVLDLRDNVIAGNKGCGVRIDDKVRLFGGNNHGGGGGGIISVPSQYRTIQSAIDAYSVKEEEKNAQGNLCPPRTLTYPIPPDLFVGEGEEWVIIISPGVYRESLNISKPVKLRGAGSGLTILDGGLYPKQDGIRIRGGVGSIVQVTIEGLTVQNFSDEGIYIQGIYTPQQVPAQVRISNSEICSNGKHGMWIGHLNVVSIQDSKIYGNGGLGIYAENCDDINISECKNTVITSNKQDPSNCPAIVTKCKANP